MDCGNATTPATFDCLFKVIFPSVFNAAIMFVGIIVVIMIVLGGMKFIASKGDNKQLDSAKKTITYAIIGAVVIIFSVFIVNIIGQITGVTCIHLFGYDTCSN